MFFVFLDLDEGWGLAIIDSIEELIYIMDRQKAIGNKDKRGFWLGGTSNIGNDQRFEYSSSTYRKDDSGDSKSTITNLSITEIRNLQ